MSSKSDNRKHNLKGGVRMENRVRERREELHMTQEELAERANVSRQTIHVLESGKADNVTLATMLAVSNALESTAEKLFL